MTRVRDFPTKAEAEEFLDALERAGGEPVLVTYLPDLGYWLVEFVPGPAGAAVEIGPADLARLCGERAGPSVS
jgi:hypothetical protein